ncbi:cellulose biosynthesis protein BcsG [Pseudomonas sp. CDFA 602]|uniref:cellulose biosynthesis protein BcsG n=1 Tax=Pseudomonas californiensis TaxID=2829823 RepID=UPI001E60930B|nr:cellulose biosynthesis protein BcsG [Pseudomonas californiensis]MCD5995621.1 cellulose biosynthesis protein BcsG [Pseudomonas californiensis]MCD6001215.1 cellulose biosynthesis protein BcsG [Pseudomonas californiensis]
MNPAEHPDATVVAARPWPGLGLWNLYFLIKLALLWGGYLNLQVLPNLLFAAVLLVPLRLRALAILRTLIAITVGVALFYQDTWLPPFSRLLDQPGVLNFTRDYLFELAGRFIDLNVCGALLILVIVFFSVRQWLRLTSVTLACLAWLGFSGLPIMQVTVPTVQASSEVVGGALPVSTAEPDSPTLDAYLQKFYSTEAARQVKFEPSDSAAQPFDLLLINICSMAWDDLEAVGLRDNPLLAQMDMVFDNFNSATAYSGPAAIRLLRASCGQQPHSKLYGMAPQQCLLMDDLRKLGFTSEVMLNHTGQFEGFIDEVRAQGALPDPAVSTADLARTLVGFDGSPIWRDREVLDKWWRHRSAQEDARVALFYNTTTLHDGNRIVTADGGTRSADYKTRAQSLIDDLGAFLKQLEKSGRRVVVVIVPEHGAALHGDRMQISGMREIPSPSITHVPVGIKLIGMGSNPRSEPLHVTGSSSYLALSEIISRLYAAPPQSPGLGPDWQVLLANLPQTPMVSENAGTVVLDYAGKPYVRIKEKGAWLPYPQRFK